MGQLTVFNRVDTILSEDYRYDKTSESAFARLDIAEKAIKLATENAAYKRLCFSGILSSWSIYSVLFLHRENIVTSNNGAKFDKFFFFVEKLHIFDKTLRSVLEKEFGFSVKEKKKRQLRKEKAGVSEGEIDRLADQYFTEVMTYLPFEAFSYAALRGACCSRRQFFIKLSEYGPIGFNSNEVKSVFYQVFGKSISFREAARLLNIYIHTYGVEKKIDGFLVDDIIMSNYIFQNRRRVLSERRW